MLGKVLKIHSIQYQLFNQPHNSWTVRKTTTQTKVRSILQKHEVAYTIRLREHAYVMSGHAQMSRLQEFQHSQNIPCVSWLRLPYTEAILAMSALHVYRCDSAGQCSACGVMFICAGSFSVLLCSSIIHKARRLRQNLCGLVMTFVPRFMDEIENNDSDSWVWGALYLTKNSEISDPKLNGTVKIPGKVFENLEIRFECTLFDGISGDRKFRRRNFRRSYDTVPCLSRSRGTAVFVYLAKFRAAQINYQLESAQCALFLVSWQLTRFPSRRKWFSNSPDK